MLFNLRLSATVFWAGFLIVLLWLSFLSFYLIRTVNHYKRLTRGVEKKDLKSILEKALKGIETNTQRISELEKATKEIKKEELFHVQKIGLLRFSPFSNTGGDQSFVLALLDAQDSGVVISSLHSRTATRIYAKSVKGGKGERYKLSKEEKEAIGIAQKKGINSSKVGLFERR